MAHKVFELNGKAYDIRTGAYLGETARVPHTAHVRAMEPKPVPQHALNHRTTTIGAATAGSTDGIIKPKHVRPHRPQATKTLMRRSVKKPAGFDIKPANKAARQAVSPGPAQGGLQPAVPAKAAATVTKPVAKLSFDMVDPTRARRARSATRSQTVRHFKSTAAPAANPYTLAGPQPAVHSGPTQPDRSRQLPAQDFRRPLAAAAVTAQRPAANRKDLNRDRQDEDFEQDLFARALADATSHQQPAPDEPALQTARRHIRRRRHGLVIAGSLSLFAILLGFVAYQNRQDIRLQMASAKAGFSAAVPLNKPDGYSMDKLSYAPGNVAMIYKNPVNDQAFTIDQKKSNWDSQTLLENYVATSNQDYQGYQSNGRTVYVVGKGLATWVNGGIWYQIKDAGSLSNEQLVHIAASM